MEVFIKDGFKNFTMLSWFSQNFQTHSRWKIVFIILLVSMYAFYGKAQYLSYPESPTLIEYDVDPDWPQRPDSISKGDYVSGLAVDDKDQVWLFTKGKDPIQVYTAEGAFVRSWGRDLFVSPHFLKIDHEGNVWVADFGLHIVQQFTPEGKLIKTLGVRGEAGEDNAHFNRPTDMAITPAGDVFITDGYGNRRIVHYDKAGNFVTAWGEYGNTPGKFILPHSIVLDSKGLLYVADRNSGRIQVFDQEGNFISQWTNLIMPWGMSINKKDEIWVCGSSPHWWFRNGVYPEYKDQVFMRFSTDGRVQQVWHIPLGDIGKDKSNPDFTNLRPGEAVGVHAIGQDSRGNLFVGEIYSRRAQKFSMATR